MSELDKDLDNRWDMFLGEEPQEDDTPNLDNKQEHDPDSEKESNNVEGLDNSEAEEHDVAVVNSDFDKIKEVLGEDVFETHEPDPIQERKQELEAYEASLANYEESVNTKKQELSQILTQYSDPKYTFNNKPFYAMTKDELHAFTTELAKQDNVPEAIEIRAEWEKINQQAKSLFDMDTEVNQAKQNLKQHKHVLEWNMAEKHLMSALPELSKHKDELVQNVKSLLDKMPQSKQLDLSYEDKVNLIKRGIKNSSFIKSKREALGSNAAASQTQPPDIAANNSKAKTKNQPDYEEKRKQMLKMSQRELAKVPEDEFWEAVFDGAV